MSTTFAGRLTSADGRDLRLYLTIDGIFDIFQEDGTDVPLAFEDVSRTRRKVIQTIEHGQSEIDLDRRRMVGGSLRVVLLDDFNETLGDLFGSRIRRTTFVTGTTTATATTINVSSTTGMSSPGIAYIGGETIYYGSTTATSLTSCIRGSYGSRASRHYGDATRGAGVFVAPPRWVGRRVRLWGYFENDDGSTTTSLRQKLDTFRLEAAPVYLGEGRWELRCSHLSDEVAARKLGTGLRKVRADPDPVTSASGDLVVKTESQTGLFVPSTTGYWPTFVALHYADADEVGVFRFKSAADSGTQTTLTMSVDGDMGGYSGGRGKSVEEIEHWAILQGAAIGQLALFALNSALGDQTNGASGFDILPGTNRDTGVGGEEVRFGAGIPEDELDYTAWLAIGGGVSGWSYIINETIGVDEFLADVCLCLECFWLVDSDGLLTVRKLSEQRTTPVLTLDDTVVIGEPTVELAEDVIYPRAKITAGYDPTTADFRDSIKIVDVEMAARYPERGDTLELQTRSLCVSKQSVRRPLVSLGMLETIVRRAMVDDGRGRLYVTIRCTLAALTVDLGDVVTIALALPDYEGGSLTNRPGRIVARKPDYDAGTVELRVQVLETLYVIAPACIIASSATTTITLQTTGAEVYNSSPGFQFAAGDKIEIVDVTAGTLEERTIASVTATTVVVTVAPTLATAGNYIRIARSTSNNGANTSTLGYKSTDYIYQQPATSTGLVTRWR